MVVVSGGEREREIYTVLLTVMVGWSVSGRGWDEGRKGRHRITGL